MSESPRLRERLDEYFGKDCVHGTAFDWFDLLAAAKIGAAIERDEIYALLGQQENFYARGLALIADAIRARGGK
jgi:hypothetical protein